MNNLITISRMTSDLEQQIVFWASRLIFVLSPIKVSNGSPISSTHQMRDRLLCWSTH